MNWLCLVIGVLLGAAGQRLLNQRQRQQYNNSDGETHPSSAPKQSAQVGLDIAAGDGGARGRPNDGTGMQSTDAEVSILVGSGNPAPRATTPPEQSLTWLAYVRALERAQFQGGFLARTAHELRSPLSSLMGLQQLILTDLCDSPEEERQCVAQSYEATQNLHRLMDQLIRVAKLEQGSQKLDIQSMDLNVLLEDVESFVYLQLADRNCRLHLAQLEQPVYCEGDYNSLRQVLVMLVEMALLHQASEIHIGLTSGEIGITISLWADKPWVPTQELQEQLEDGQGCSWSEEDLAQLKQSLAQDPSASFVPHRLSPGMVLLISQFMLDLNGGGLRLTDGKKKASGVPFSAAMPTAQASAAEESPASPDQGYILELRLPSGQS